MITVKDELFFEVIDALAKEGALFGCAVFELKHQGLNRPLLAEILDFEIFEIFRMGGLLQLVQKVERSSPICW